MTSKTPNLNSSLPALQHVTSASQDGQGSDPNVLPGRYKVFFTPDAHARVSQWYHERANLDQRHEFKRLVKAISNFDGEAEKKKLRVGFTPSVTPAHAVLMHNGADIIDPSFHDRVVLYLALAKPAELHAFRNVFGQIDPPTTTKLAKTHYTSQFADGTKYMKGELMLRDTSKKVVGKGHVLPPSHPTTAPCEVVGDGKSQYGLFYAWKVAPKTKANVVQKAHESSSHGAPWGEYGGGRWVPQTKEDFEDREYRAPKVVGEGPDAKVIVEARRFQNYNDNLSHDVYRTQRLLRKQRRLPGEFAAQTSLMFSTAPTAEVMKPQRPIPPPPAPSPIFCR